MDDDEKQKAIKGLDFLKKRGLEEVETETKSKSSSKTAKKTTEDISGNAEYWLGKCDTCDKYFLKKGGDGNCCSVCGNSAMQVSDNNYGKIKVHNKDR